MNLYIFYIFSVFLVFFSVLVITTKNPVHSVLFLIASFFCVAIIFVLQSAEFLAMLLIIIYVGAVAVLFLFVVMMMNIKIAHISKTSILYGLVSFSLIGILLFQLYIISINVSPIKGKVAYPINYSLDNIDNIASVLYTDFALHIQIAGLILLVAIIGAIMLGHRKSFSKKQNVFKQISRNAKKSVKLVKVKSKEL